MHYLLKYGCIFINKRFNSFHWDDQAIQTTYQFRQCLKWINLFENFDWLAYFHKSLKKIHVCTLFIYLFIYWQSIGIHYFLALKPTMLTTKFSYSTHSTCSLIEIEYGYVYMHWFGISVAAVSPCTNSFEYSTYKSQHSHHKLKLNELGSQKIGLTDSTINVGVPKLLTLLSWLTNSLRNQIGLHI